MTLRTILLGDFAAINPKHEKGTNPDTPVSFVGMSGIDSGSASVTREETRMFKETAKGFTQFKKGDILLAKITPCFENGKIAQATISEPLGSGSTEFHVIRAREGSADPRFLLHMLRHPKILFDGERKMTGSSGHRRVPEPYLASITIPNYPLEIQKRTREALDALESLRARRRRSIKLLDELTQSIFLDMFGDARAPESQWESADFSEALTTSPRNGLSPSKDGNFSASVLTLSAITGKTFNPDAHKEGTFKETPPSGKSVRRSDFLVCRGNGNIDLVGRGYFPTEDMPTMTFPDTIIASPVDQGKISHKFLETLWKQDSIREQIKSVARTTNGTFKINQRSLENIRIIIPPISLQREFSEKVWEIEELKAKHQTHLDHLNELFASVQQRAFDGTLWDDPPIAS